MTIPRGNGDVIWAPRGLTFNRLVPLGVLALIKEKQFESVAAYVETLEENTDPLAYAALQKFRRAQGK